MAGVHGKMDRFVGRARQCFPRLAVLVNMPPDFPLFLLLFAQIFSGPLIGPFFWPPFGSNVAVHSHSFFFVSFTRLC